ncbi:MAG TPA: 30S ribosomal protein S16 [Dehalococcoidia bacterium]|nr:30S ribosomal protein S16 [Dehalococcoidia bacterium]
MLKIRLARVGKKKQPTYRVVIADARAPRDGKYVEIVGSYNPRTEPDTFVIDEDKVKDWLSKGAQPTMRMRKLLARQGLMAAPTFPPPKPKPAPETAAPQAAAPAATAVAELEASAEEAGEEEPAAEQPATEDAPAEDASAEAPDAKAPE